MSFFVSYLPCLFLSDVQRYAPFFLVHEKSNQSNFPWIYSEVLVTKRRPYPFPRQKNICLPKRNTHLQKYKLRSFYAILFVSPVFLSLLFGSSRHRLDDACWNTSDHGICRYIFCDNRACCQNRIITHSHTWQNGDM